MFQLTTVTLWTPLFPQFNDVKTAIFQFNAVNSDFFPIQRQ